MNNQKRFPEHFKIAAVKQITERGRRVAEVASRLDVSQHSLYAWMKRYGVVWVEKRLCCRLHSVLNIRLLPPDRIQIKHLLHHCLRQHQAPPGLPVTLHPALRAAA